MSVFDQDLGYDKIFMTGIYASGKTTTAREISSKTGLPYLGFDKMWNYRSKDAGQARAHFASLGERFVIDGIGFSPMPDFYSDFTEAYKAWRSVLILCTTCLDIDVWLGRVHQRGWGRNAKAQYVHFYQDTLPLHRGKEIRYYDTNTNCYVQMDTIQEYVGSL